MSCTKQNKERTDSEQTFLWMPWPVLFCVCVSQCICVYVSLGRNRLSEKNRVERLSPGKEGLHVWSFWHAALLTRSKWGQGDHIALLAPLTIHHFFFCLLVRLWVGSLNDGDTVGSTQCLPSKHFPHSAPSKLSTFPSHTSLAALRVFLQRKHEYWLPGKRHF